MKNDKFMTSIVLWIKRAFPYGSLSKACLVSLLRVKYNEVIIKVLLRRTKSMVVHLFGFGCVGCVVSSELKKKVYYSKMQDAMDELIIAGTLSLHQAIKSIQCLRQHDLPHHTWHTSPCLGKIKVFFTTSHLCLYSPLNLMVFRSKEHHVSQHMVRVSQHMVM